MARPAAAADASAAAVGARVTLAALGALALTACTPCGDRVPERGDRSALLARLDGVEELRALRRDGDRRAVLHARVACF